MPLLHRVLGLLPRTNSEASHPPDQPGRRLAKLTSREELEITSPGPQAVLFPFEEECAEPLYEPSVYSSREVEWAEPLS